MSGLGVVWLGVVWLGSNFYNYNLIGGKHDKKRSD